MTAGLVLLVAALLLATGALAVVRAGRPRTRELVYGASLAAMAVILALALGALLAGQDSALRLPLGLPWIGARFRIDALSSFFLLVLGLGGGFASLYGLGYGRHETAPERVLPFYPLFLAGMALVLLADDAFTFLFAWELMSLASWALVLTQHRIADNRQAGYVYLAMASSGTVALLLAFGLLAGATGAYGFTEIRAAVPTPLTATLVLLLVLAGAGSKAGLVPLHVWLPLAHPAAPSHVSALMSGVMTKVAIYGFLRIVMDLLGEPPWWASLLVLFLGGATAVIGILMALMQRDLKRLLAYSTIENVGIVFVGIGLALAFRANGMAAAAALALTAALFHVANHAVFKSLLFMGAGAVLTSTGTADMERLGGLIHRLPVTAVVVLVGSVAIAALPPFNGFASEWLLLQAILLSPELGDWGLKVMVPAVGAMLALAAALAAACFVKAYGITFLGRPRSSASTGALEVDRLSLAAMIGLAALCLLAGILPGLVIDALSPVATSLLDRAMPTQHALAWLTIVPIAESRSSYNGLLVFLFILASSWLMAWAIHRFASRNLRRGPAWGCGFDRAVPANQYSGASLVQPIQRVLGPLLLRSKETVDLPRPGELRPARHELHQEDVIWDRLYAPLAGLVDATAGRLNALQFLTIRRYLGLVFGALVLLLLALALWG